MKYKATFVAFFLLLFVGQTFAQYTSPKEGGWLWREDDGDDNNATTYTEETPIAISSFNNIRLRVEMYDSQSDNNYYSDHLTISLFYSTDQTNWHQLKTTVDYYQPFIISASDYYNDMDISSQNLILDYKGHSSTGYLIESRNSFAYTFYEQGNVEFEFCLKPSSEIQPNTTYYFALYQAGSANLPAVLPTSPGYPSLTTTSAMPVELSSFSAVLKNANVILNWNTATEVNNYGFQVERAIQEPVSKTRNWEKIGFVNGAGNSNSPKSYSFTDKSISTNSSLTYSYRLKQIDNDGKFEYSKMVDVSVAQKPGGFTLNQNYPNPFNPTTNISYSLEKDSKVSLKIYNLLGKEVTALVNENETAGYHSVKFDASNLSSGIYLYKLQAGDFTAIKKLTLIK